MLIPRKWWILFTIIMLISIALANLHGGWTWDLGFFDGD